MGRNIIVCFDGTNNQFGPANTNVVRLIQSLARDSALQRVYYDPGVGTLPEPAALTRVGKWFSKIAGLAFGAGLGWKVQEAYTYLMDFWEPGDQVFLFGFSRGAYSARVLAGMLHSLGLLPRGGYNLVPYVFRLYKSVRKAGSNEDSNYWRLCHQFRQTFARKVETNRDDRRFPVRFLGLWDTVSSVGWVWNPAAFPYTSYNPSVSIIRHAVSVDERRSFFKQNLMQNAEGQDFKELWFPGVHCDVGGGYPRTGGKLWQEPFVWIVREAQRRGGLCVDEKAFVKVLGEPPCPAPWCEEQHESLTWYWWPAEFFPKLVWNPALKIRLPQLNAGRRRTIQPGSVLHSSVLKRIKDPDRRYKPRNLPESTIAGIKAMQTVPDEYPVG